MTIDLATLLTPDGPIARRLDGFELRPQQRRMAEAVQQALAGRDHLMVEAGTGVGKSFAYLLPAIQRIVEHDERVVVATNTINLQEQLVDKDIPLLNAVMPEEFSAVLVKGRGNYVSLRRLKLASERQDKLFPDDASQHALHQLEEWAYRTDDGSRSSMEQEPRSDVWDHVQSDAGNCMGRKCPTFDKCFFQRARRRMEHGDLLICNHALFFADLSLRASGVGFLPPYDHVILDEAHNIEDIAAEHFGLSLSRSRVDHLLRLLHHPRKHRGYLASLQLKDDQPTRVDETINHVLRCQNISDRMFDELHEWLQNKGPKNGRIREPDIVENHLTAAMKQLSDRLKLLKDSAKREADEFELRSYSQRALDIAKQAEMLIQQQVDGCVYWLEAPQSFGKRKRARKPRLTMKCMAVDVAPILRQHLFDDEKGVVLTSATLATGPGDFSHFVRRLGCETATTMQVGSPFHYGDQMAVYVDRTMPEPSSREYLPALQRRLLEQIRATDGGAFVLFTSFDMLNRAADALAQPLTSAGYDVLVQGQDGPPSLLLKRFRKSVRAVLFGTGRFWQGVDVRGQALRNVIITRLPFAVPDQPLIEARHEFIRERGGNPFMQDQVPTAVIRFKQGIGRLIRSAEDEGRVVVLDSRIVNKPYGRAFMRALPEEAVVHQCDDQVSEMDQLETA